MTTDRKRLCASWEVLKIYPFDTEHYLLTNEVRNVQEHSRFIDSGSWFHVVETNPPYSGGLHPSANWCVVLDDQDDHYLGLVLDMEFAKEVVNSNQSMQE